MHKYQVGDIVKIENDAPLSGNYIAPPVVIGEDYEIKHTITDSRGHQHLDLGLKSDYMSVKSWETGEDLPDGETIHWVHPSRVKLITSKIK